MTKKLEILISSILGACSTTAIALVTYFDPSNATIINGAISFGVASVITILEMFTKADNKLEK